MNKISSRVGRVSRCWKVSNRSEYEETLGAFCRELNEHSRSDEWMNGHPRSLRVSPAVNSVYVAAFQSDSERIYRVMSRKPRGGTIRRGRKRTTTQTRIFVILFYDNEDDDERIPRDKIELYFIAIPKSTRQFRNLKKLLSHKHACIRKLFPLTSDDFFLKKQKSFRAKTSFRLFSQPPQRTEIRFPLRLCLSVCVAAMIFRLRQREKFRLCFQCFFKFRLAWFVVFEKFFGEKSRATDSARRNGI